MSVVHPASPQARERVVLGVIGGSGLYDMEQLHRCERVSLETPFGAPSDAYTVGEIEREDGAPLRTVFLPRHGAQHRLLPGEINYRANLHGLKQLGVTHLVAVSAVGSLRESIAPGDVVLPDQFIDLTRGRTSTFFGQGVAAHVQFGEPTSPELRALVTAAVREQAATLHAAGTCIVMEGPAFSSRAESELYRGWGAHIIGMTAMPEAKLAREAEMAYAPIALCTDYDCWHDTHEEVSVDSVVAVLKANVALARRVLLSVARKLPERTSDLPYPQSCRDAVITSPDGIDAIARARLDLIVGHYLG
ncbi:MAG: S-methyl-5'-thioadenosine phosphorylase [Myxococcales bacterium FL481]|nr:MAG: S-methyl-5'-thioadenosine phosphorylase [Myxococcales bacterium FL481]